MYRTPPSSREPSPRRGEDADANQEQRTSRRQQGLPPEYGILEDKEAAKGAPLHALRGPEPIKRSSSQGWANKCAVEMADAEAAHKAEQGQLSEPNFTWTPTPPLGMRKSYYFPDPPLPKEVHFAMALLVLAILSVALLLAYDVYHSFAHMPRRSNVTATGLSPTTTEPIPTPVFMR
ncbi:hypothetical protein HPB51_022119 [Rhipicephalus microplus]|uniref:Uncharacterized protein n=1 Tax=Rhipicephalus microplus TaxID=6941 RepID=A0A9J6ECB8_RHIMP|nr:hypothetical protein HPB51_022119 [Rhipicephalus microplus]